MPRVGDLSKCKIYKITSLNNPELVYYGHTCQTLAQRFASHKKISNDTTSKIVIEKGDAVILLVEDYPCDSEDKAKAREAYYILNYQCVNKNVPGRSRKEYYEANKDQIIEYKKQYRESHKDQIKQYRESHKEEIKQYRELHKDDIKELMHNHQSEREVIMKEFTSSINKLESENKASSDKLTTLYMDLKITLEKLISTFSKSIH